MKPLVWIGAGLCAGLTASLLLTGRTAPLPSAPAPQVSIAPPGSGPSETPTRLDTSSPAAPTGDPPAQSQLMRLRQGFEGKAPLLSDGETLSIVQAWSRSDAETVLGCLANAPRVPGRLELLAIPLAQLAQRDPASAAAWVRANLAADERGRTVYRVVDNLVQTSPAHALQLIQRLDVPTPAYLASRALQLVGQENPIAAAEAFRGLPADAQEYCADDVARSLSKKDPEAAIAWTLSLSSPEARSRAKAEIIRSALERKPDEVQALLQRLGADKETIQDALDRAPSSLSRIPFELLARLPDEPRGDWVATWALHHCETRPELVLSTVKQMLPPGRQAAALREAVERWGHSDRKGALAWLSQQNDPLWVQARHHLETVNLPPLQKLAALDRLPLNEASDEVIASALARARHLEPAAAAAWLSQHADRAKPEWVRPVAETYLAKDDAAAAEWLRSLPRGPVRDEALRIAAKHWAENGDADIAGETVQLISTPTTRLASAANAFLSAYRKNPDQARELWSRQQLSPETRVVLEAMAEEDRRLNADGEIILYN